MRTVFAFLGTLFLALPAQAFVPTEVELRPGLELASGDAARIHPDVAQRRVDATEAGRRFLQQIGGRWQGLFDTNTGVPRRLYGSGLAVPGSVDAPEIAERTARALLNEHVELLAPGTKANDFTLVSNVVSNGVRSVGFVQRQAGLLVDGGQLSFRFKKDRLIAIGSEARPHVDLAIEKSVIDETTAVALAQDWIERDFGVRGEVVSVKGPLIHVVPLANGGQVAATVLRATLRTSAPSGRFEVDIDRASGALFARRQTLLYASGTLRYRIPDRHPGNGRIDAPAELASITVDGAPARTGVDGVFTWTSSASAQVMATVIGPHVRVLNAAGATASTTFSLADGGSFVWDVSNNEGKDAQLTTFIATQQARDYMTGVSPNLPYLASQVEATVNIAEVCNAFSDGMTINFFQSGGGCENTGRLPDVVHHEYGHAIHANSIIQGVGSFDTSLSEGASDYLAATIVGDPGMGRGFFFSNDPLRDLDPVGSEATWPDDRGEPHVTGLIFAGAMWDLRKTLIDLHGPTEGVAISDALWYAVLQRAADIPSAYVEVLVADDDDGDLANGSPHICEITSAFSAHGLADGGVAGLQIGKVEKDGNFIALPVGDGPALCPGSEYTGATVEWELRGVPGMAGTLEMTRVPGRFEAELPALPDGEVVRYRVELSLGDGTARSYPNNPADPAYETFLGEVSPIYCTDFETDPTLDGWTSEMISGGGRNPTDEWEWGIPIDRGSGDPGFAFSGDRVIGNDLGNQSRGTYQRDKIEEMRSPTIDVSGYEHVRLQYRRWLTIEDGDFDQAQIFADGELLWSNFASGLNEPNGANAVHHIDREWRFHDVDLSAAASDGQVQIAYRLSSDQSLSLGGWTIDDFCVVNWKGPTAACGDGRLDAGEACDDGNQLAQDGCEADCTLTPEPVCGNGIVELGETCDGSVGCAANCQMTPDPDPTIPDGSDLDTLEDDGGCGCHATETRSSPMWWLLAGLLGALGLRRRS